jgi:ATP-binding cassette subfamily F protein 3
MIKLENIEKSYGIKTILKNVSYQFPENVRLALSGPNGAGKTTLLNIISGLEEQDSGKILTPKSTKIGYLPQEANKNPKASILEEAMSGATYLWKLRTDFEHLSNRLSEVYDEALLLEFQKIEEEYRLNGGYELESYAKSILSGLGFKTEDFYSSPKSLSGGFIMRVELSKILLNSPNFLILDEPTNHLDLPSLFWLEDYLMKFEGTLVFVSHDRKLLNKLAQKTLFLSHGNLEEYPCNFDSMLEMRLKNFELNDSKRRNIQERRMQIQSFVDRFHAKASKAAQVRSRVKMLEKLSQLEEEIPIENAIETISLKFPLDFKSGKNVLSIKEMSFGYEKNTLFKKINLHVFRAQKIAIIGRNGIGKSSLLKAILGTVKASSGSIELGHNVQIAYFSQHQVDALSQNSSVISQILENSDLSEKMARSLLGLFLFKGDDVFKTIDVLSGGEKSRVALCQILASGANTLLLDEPTNHLDIPTIEILTEALKNYEGTLLFVSHDRDFVNQISTHILVIDEDKGLEIYEGHISDYERACKLQGRQTIFEIKKENEKIPQNKDHSLSKELKKDLRKAKKNLSLLEEKISSSDKELNNLNLLLEDLDPKDFQKINEIKNRVKFFERSKEDLESQWLEMSLKIENLE